MDYVLFALTYRNDKLFRLNKNQQMKIRLRSSCIEKRIRIHIRMRMGAACYIPIPEQKAMEFFQFRSVQGMVMHVSLNISIVVIVKCILNCGRIVLTQVLHSPQFDRRVWLFTSAHCKCQFVSLSTKTSCSHDMIMNRVVNTSILLPGTVQLITHYTF